MTSLLIGLIGLQALAIAQAPDGACCSQGFCVLDEVTPASCVEQFGGTWERSCFDCPHAGQPATLEQLAPLAPADPRDLTPEQIAPLPRAPRRPSDPPKHEVAFPIPEQGAKDYAAPSKHGMGLPVILIAVMSVWVWFCVKVLRRS